MEYAMTTDYRKSVGVPDGELQYIAEAGWRYLHWCHQWDTDFMYGRAELKQIKKVLRELKLQILDIHGSSGQEKRWDSVVEYQREAGVELVRNRLEMASEVGCDVVIMHGAEWYGNSAQCESHWEAYKKSMDELVPIGQRLGVRIAVENMAVDNFDMLERSLKTWPNEWVGICYDPGHGNIAKNGLDRLAPLAKHLFALHLNDNDSTGDQHRPLYQGTVDFTRLAGIIKAGGYNRKAISVEVASSQLQDADAVGYLRDVMGTVKRFDQLLN